MTKTVLVMPGSNMQVPLIKRIKEKGIRVLCIDPNKNAPAFRYADYCENSDILAVNTCKEIAARYNVVAIVSDECDIAVRPIAEICDSLRLPSIGIDKAALFTNKALMRSFCKENGFPSPNFKKCKTVSEACAFYRALNNPKMIMKPVDSNSSRGVYTITSIEDISKFFDSSISFSKGEGSVICEEYIEGTEFTVDGIVVGGKHYSLCISKKKHYSHNANIAKELLFSHFDEKYDYGTLRKQNDLFVEKAQLPFGFTHAEYKYNGKAFVLIEIGARGGGNFISSHIVPWMTGIDNYEYLITQSMGISLDEGISIKDEYKERCSVLEFFDIAKENDRKQLKRITGEDFLNDNSNIDMYHFNFNPGDQVFLPDDDSKRIGFYIAHAKNREILNGLMAEIKERVEFVF